MMYDPAGRLTQQIDPNGKNTLFTYDAAGRLATVTDPNNNTTQNFYDQDGRLARQTAPIPANGSPVSDTYYYDAGSRLTAHIDRLNRQDLYSYDADNRTTAVTWKDAGGINTTNQQAFTFDPNGNVITAGDNNGNYAYSYDLLNRATQVQQPFSESVSYTYDAADRLTGMHDSFGGNTTYTFDPANRLTTVLFSSTNNGVTSEYTRLDLSYDARNALGTETRGMSLQQGTQVIGTASYSYDTGGRVTNITDRNGGGATVDAFNYTYDSANRDSTETSTLGLPLTYSYDADSQVLSDGRSSTSYDANGNRNTTGYTTTYANELSSDGTYSYTYDAEGNLTVKAAINGSVIWDYQYDNANRLTQAVEYTPQGGSTAVYKETYKYDVWGNRIELDIYPNGDNTTTPTVTRFEYDQYGNAYADFGTNGLGTMRRLYLQGTDALFARYDGNGVASWYLTDRLGSVRDLVDSSGSLKDHLDYNGYGQLINESVYANGDRYKYAAREFDFNVFNGAMQRDQTGLVFNRARVLDPSTDRFLQQDPLGFSAGDVNLYRDVGNSMPNFTDPSGLQRATAEDLVAAPSDGGSYAGDPTKKKLGKNYGGDEGGILQNIFDFGLAVEGLQDRFFDRAIHPLRAWEDGNAAYLIPGFYRTQQETQQMTRQIAEAEARGGSRWDVLGQYLEQFNQLPDIGRAIGQGDATYLLPGAVRGQARGYVQGYQAYREQGLGESGAAFMSIETNTPILRSFAHIGEFYLGVSLQAEDYGGELSREGRIERMTNMMEDGINVGMIVAGGGAAEEGNGPTPRRSSRSIRNEWQRETGQQWPRDPATGRNMDVAHNTPLADGGSNELSNVQPLPHVEHVQQHIANGDFKRWGARRY
jgi:RHS repeat-associated protein